MERKSKYDRFIDNERLVIKTINGYKLAINDKEDIMDKSQEAFNKLGMLEDIEDEIGFNLLDIKDQIIEFFKEEVKC